MARSLAAQYPALDADLLGQAEAALSALYQHDVPAAQRYEGQLHQALKGSNAHYALDAFVGTVNKAAAKAARR